MTSIDELRDRVPVPAGADIRTERIRYRHDDTELEGVLAYDAAAGPRPGVLIAHDWMGVGEYSIARAEMLARLGYTAFALDMYGAGVQATPETAPQLAGSLYRDPELMRGRACAGLETLRADARVADLDPVALGYCFGGTVALELARTGAALSAAVCFHGRLIVHEPPDAERIRARVLVLNGASDPTATDADVAAFQDELRTAPDVDWRVVQYSGAVHAFTVPTANHPGRAEYDERADRRSWRELLDLLAEVFPEG